MSALRNSSFSALTCKPFQSLLNIYSVAFFLRSQSLMTDHVVPSCRGCCVSCWELFDVSLWFIKRSIIIPVWLQKCHFCFFWFSVFCLHYFTVSFIGLYVLLPVEGSLLTWSVISYVSVIVRLQIWSSFALTQPCSQPCNMNSWNSIDVFLIL